TGGFGRRGPAAVVRLGARRATGGGTVGVRARGTFDRARGRLGRLLPDGGRPAGRHQVIGFVRHGRGIAVGDRLGRDRLDRGRLGRGRLRRGRLRAPPRAGGPVADLAGAGGP